MQTFRRRYYSRYVLIASLFKVGYFRHISKSPDFVEIEIYILFDIEIGCISRIPDFDSFFVFDVVECQFVQGRVFSTCIDITRLGCNGD